MAVNALNDDIEMSENLNDLVLIRVLEDKGSDRLMYFLSLYPKYL